MKKTFRPLLAVILVIAMILPCFPLISSAESLTYEKTGTAYTISGVYYYQAKTTSDYNGVNKGTLFWVDAKGNIIVDRDIIAKLALVDKFYSAYKLNPDYFSDMKNGLHDEAAELYFRLVTQSKLFDKLGSWFGSVLTTYAVVLSPSALPTLADVGISILSDAFSPDTVTTVVYMELLRYYSNNTGAYAKLCRETLDAKTYTEYNTINEAIMYKVYSEASWETFMSLVGDEIQRIENQNDFNRFCENALGGIIDSLIPSISSVELTKYISDGVISLLEFGENCGSRKTFLNKVASLLSSNLYSVDSDTIDSTFEVSKKLAKKASTATYTTGTYKPSDEIGLNIRSGASTSNSVISTIVYGTSFVVTEISGSWGKTTSGGVTGWVCLDYATKVSTNTSTGTTSGAQVLSSGLVSPVNNRSITSNFQPWYRQDYKNSWAHVGIDYVSKSNDDNIYAFYNGTVTLAITGNKSAGNFIEIKHEYNGTTFYSYYFHLSSFCVSKGDVVTAGTKVGVMGATGDVTGKHLHFQINNKSVYSGGYFATPSSNSAYSSWSIEKQASYPSFSTSSGYIYYNPEIVLTKGLGIITGSSTATYNIDVNGYVDGEYKTSLNGFVTFDVYINGSLAKSGVGDFCTAYADGTKYEIKNIKAASGYTYASGSNLTGTISGGHAYPSITLTTTIKEPSDTSSLPDGWLESIPSSESSKNYKSAVFYRYRDTTYGSWSASQTTSTAPTASDVLQIVSTTKYYNYYHYCCQYYDGGCYVDSIKYGTGGLYHTLKTTTKLTSASVEDKGGKTLYGGESKWACSKNFHVWAQAPPFETSEYSYQTRTKSISNWSAWSQTKPSSSSGREIESIKLYNYQPLAYTVSYNANGGSGAPVNQTKTENVALTLSTTVPTRSGYTFKGWATSATGSVAYQPGASFTTNANTTLYAVWQKNTVPSAGKLVIDSKTCTVGSTVKLDVKVEGNTGFAFLSLTAQYDKNALELVNVEKGTLISDMTASKNIVFVADDNVKGNGLLLSLTFKFKENADSGDYTIGLSVNELYDQDANDKSFTVSGGKLTVMSFVYGDANGDGKVDGKDIVLLKKYIANYDYDTGKSTVSICAGADANGDGKVDGKDIVLLKKYIANYDYDTGKSSIVLGPTK